MTKQEQIDKQIIFNQKEEIENLKTELEKYKNIVSVLKEQADAKGMDVLAYIKEFQDLINEARENLKSVIELRNNMILEKAKYQERMEEAVRNIVGPYF